jgi:ParB/RepB/Spo0J family partition protein
MPGFEVRFIPVDHIHPNPDNPRHEAGNVSALSRSIDERELEQAIDVIPAPQFGGDHFMIVDGFRRWSAGRHIRRSLPCHIRYPRPEENIPMMAVLMGLVTDAHKEPLSAMERAEAYGRLHNEFGLTQTQIAKQTGFTTTTIGYYMSLLELSEDSKQKVREGKMSADRAVSAVREHRQKNRSKEGKKPVNLGWDPDPFNPTHPQNKKAKVMCAAREHGGRRRYAGACHACWEMAIRQDQTTIDTADYGDAGLAIPFVSPAPLMPISPDGDIRTDWHPTNNGNGRRA